MGKSVFSKAKSYILAKKRKSRRFKVFAVLAAMVVFCTVYALILPAITLERETLCGMTEHIHTEDCYANEQKLLCTEEHAHTEDCYEIRSMLICDQIEHEHIADCYPEEPLVADSETTEATNTVADELANTQNSTAEGETAAVDNSDSTWGTVEVVAAEGKSAAAMKSVPMTLAADGGTESAVTAFSLTDQYITKTTLLYKSTGETGWTEVTGTEVTLRGDDAIRLEVNYENIPIANLKASGYQMTYTLPEGLRNAVADGNITSGPDVVGTITASGNTVTIIFDQTWLDAQTGETLKGDFYVEGRLDLSNIDTETPGSLVIGGVTINLEHTDDIIARYGKLDIEKTVSSKVIQTETGDFLEYTLTVTTGEDGCPDVKVADSITAGKNFVSSYVGVTGNLTDISSAADASPRETSNLSSFTSGQVCIGTLTDGAVTEGGENYEAPGTLIWQIGEMKANETRTLTYRVQLTENYCGSSSQGNIRNGADVYSKTYHRDGDTANFTPKAGAKMNKSSADPIKNDDGSYTINYTIWITANSNNAYTLENLKIKDSLDGSCTGGNSTDPKILPYLSYVTGSWQLYQGKNNFADGNKLSPENPNGGANPVMGTNNQTFSYYVGNLAPGESKTLTYQIRLDPGAFALMGSNDFKINNRALILHEGTSETGDHQFNAYSYNKTITHKQWARKLAGDVVAADTEIVFDGTDPVVYKKKADGTYEVNNKPDASFTVPAGSFLYRAAVNETGDWDVSSAVLEDTLGSQYMNFVGYIRVDAYIIDSNAPKPGSSNSNALTNLGNRTPEKTVWVEASGTSFSFTPKDIGLSGTYAYRLTYYAQPVNTDDITQIIVANQFSISGDVGIGGGKYILTGVIVKADVTISGGNYFAAEKSAWYYDGTPGDTAKYPKGALYWTIKVEGNTIPAGTTLKDITNSKGSSHYLVDNSVAGVFTAAFPGEQPITSYPSWNDVPKDDSVSYKAIDSADYTVTKESNTSAEISFNNDVKIPNNSSLYIVIRTAPQVKPSEDRENERFYNSLQSKNSGADTWVDHNTAEKIIYGSENIFKELGKVVTYDGSTLTVIKDGNGGNVLRNLLPASGTYVSWTVKINYEGNLSGTYRAIDTIPEGMELVYVRLKWRGSDAGNTNVDQISPAPEGWTEHSVTGGTDNNGSAEQKTFFYTKDNQVMWQISGYEAKQTFDSCSTDIQVVCRVTDLDVLLGAEEKAFNNTVTLETMEGTQIGSDNDSVNIKRVSLTKAGTYDAQVNGGRYPFKISVNPLGEDLSLGTNELTIVDTLDKVLVLDPNTLKVVNTKTNEGVAFTSSLDQESNTLKIVVPDNQPLTITYETMVNAAPGDSVSFSNTAHWEGYTAPTEGSVTVKNFSYQVGGTVGTETSPKISITKVDQYNTQQKLVGAEFKLTECTFNGDTISETTTSLTGTTDENGALIFGAAGELKYNTVYCLVETKAPAGYVLDASPHYFAVVNESGAADHYPAGITIYGQDAVYKYSAYNHKGEIKIVKNFLDAGGSPTTPIDGTYTFGLFDNSEGTGSPLQKITVTVTNGAGNTGKFTNLELERI